MKTIQKKACPGIHERPQDNNECSDELGLGGPPMIDEERFVCDDSDSAGHSHHKKTGGGDFLLNQHPRKRDSDAQHATHDDADDLVHSEISEHLKDVFVLAHQVSSTSQDQRGPTNC